jgi:DNA-binding NarL/FixJ family response regulator
MSSVAVNKIQNTRSPSVLTLQSVEGRVSSDDVRIPVLLIDCRPLARELLVGWLEASSCGFRALTLSTPGDLVGCSDRFSDARLVIFNIGAAAVTDGAVARGLDLLSREFPDVPIVLFAEREELTQIVAALRQGVRGYISSTLSPEVVVEALRLVRAGGTFVPADVFAKAAEQREQAGPAVAPAVDGKWKDFTPRELEVLDRLRQGMSNKVIAHELSICDGTVKVHIKHIMRKLKATNRTQAALLASQSLNNV